MKLILLFLISLAVYFAFRLIGEDGRRAVWVAVKPHFFPVAVILFALLAALFYTLAGGSVALF
jgi:hypothetical protein